MVHLEALYAGSVLTGIAISWMVLDHDVTSNLILLIPSLVALGLIAHFPESQEEKSDIESTAEEPLLRQAQTV